VVARHTEYANDRDAIEWLERQIDDARGRLSLMDWSGWTRQAAPTVRALASSRRGAWPVARHVESAREGDDRRVGAAAEGGAMTYPIRTAIDILAASHKLRALLWPLDQYAMQVDELLAEHPEFAPELMEANRHVMEASQAIKRAHEFGVAKYEVEKAR
jgi:hypothetical protein